MGEGMDRRDLLVLERTRVLTVEPNRHMRTLLKGVLQAFGIRDVVEVSDAAAALRELNALDMDLVITEYALEPLTGTELVRMIRNETGGRHRMVPIIMLTSYSEIHRVAEARDAGISEFLSKPISPQSLLARLNAALRRPRPFIRTTHYFGPDRRRHPQQEIHHSDRRTPPPQ